MAFRGTVCAVGGGYVSEDRLKTMIDVDHADLLAVGAKTVKLERRFNTQAWTDRETDLPTEKIRSRVDSIRDENSSSVAGAHPHPPFTGGAIRSRSPSESDVSSPSSCRTCVPFRVTFTLPRSSPSVRNCPERS